MSAMKRPKPTASAWPAPTILANVRLIPLGQLAPDPHQPRKELDTDELTRLAGSLAALGQLQTIRVRPPTPESSPHQYIIISGERRWRAAQQAGLTGLRCEVVEGHEDPGELLLEQLAENAAREDLAPMDRARALRRLQIATRGTTASIARDVGISQSSTVKSLALLDLPLEVQDLVESGDLAPATAYELGRLPEAGQAGVAAQACAGGWTRAQVIQEVERRLNPPPAPGPRTDAGATTGPPAGPRIGQAGAPGTPPERVLIYDRPLAGATAGVQQRAATAVAAEIEAGLDQVEPRGADGTAADYSPGIDPVAVWDARRQALAERGAVVVTESGEDDDVGVELLCGHDPERAVLISVGTLPDPLDGRPGAIEAVELALAELRRRWGTARYWPAGTRVRIESPGHVNHGRTGVIVDPHLAAEQVMAWVRLDGAAQRAVAYAEEMVTREDVTR